MEILNSEWFKGANKLISDLITNLDQYKYCNKKQKGEKWQGISRDKQLKLQQPSSSKLKGPVKLM